MGGLYSFGLIVHGWHLFIWTYCTLVAFINWTYCTWVSFIQMDKLYMLAFIHLDLFDMGGIYSL